MGVAVVEPQPRLARRAADHRTGVSKTRPRAHPGLRLDALAERIERLRGGQHPLDLDRRRRGVAMGELGAGGEPDALLHWSEAIAVIGVDDRPGQPGIALRLVV